MDGGGVFFGDSRSKSENEMFSGSSGDFRMQSGQTSWRVLMFLKVENLHIFELQRAQ